MGWLIEDGKERELTIDVLMDAMLWYVCTGGALVISLTCYLSSVGSPVMPCIGLLSAIGTTIFWWKEVLLESIKKLRMHYEDSHRHFDPI